MKFQIKFTDVDCITEPVTLEDLLYGNDIEFRSKDGTMTLTLDDFRFYYGKGNENHKVIVIDDNAIADFSNKENLVNRYIEFDICDSGFKFGTIFKFDGDVVIINQLGEVYQGEYFNFDTPTMRGRKFDYDLENNSLKVW